MSTQSVVAQATAVITVLVAFIYVSGALTLIFKLWYLQVPFTSVLGQLPHDFIITTAFTQVIAPTLAVAGILTFVHSRYLRWSWAHKARPRRQNIGVKCALGFARYLLINLVLVGPALLILWLMGRYGNTAVLRDPGWNLIGSNSQDIYLAQWHLGADGNITPSNQIAVVPQSTVDLEVLGSHANCSDLG